MIFKFVALVYALILWQYLAINLQWYAYKLKRVVFKTAKPLWHIWYFVFPYFVFVFLSFTTQSEATITIATVIYGIIFGIWYKKLDKPLVYTPRVKRFFIVFLALIIPPILLLSDKSLWIIVLFCLVTSHLISTLVEKKLSLIYENEAMLKLDSNPNRIVIAITASYGKTSIKNILAAILKMKYTVYATPRSVNTKKGVMKDINENLNDDISVYIVEAGAREIGDIAEIADLARPHYVVIGKIGTAHLEYFGSTENIKNTKRELLGSMRLKKAFVFENASQESDENIFSENQIQELKADLSGISFLINDKLYAAPLLGAFNATNILAAILVARELGVEDEQIAIALAKLKPVEHRLQKIEANGKIILDDSFNGNFEGMSEGIRLCSLYDGFRVIVTPGIVEVDDDINIKLAQKIDVIFDLVIITGGKNAKILDEYIKKPQKIIINDKTKLTETLAKETKSGYLIYFANDAPNFI